MIPDFDALNDLQCPDWVLWDFSGDRLTLKGGHVSSSWDAATVVFNDVAYLELPAYFHHAHFLVSPDFDGGRLKQLECYDTDLTAFGIITEFGALDGDEQRFYILAAGCAVTIPGP